MQPRDIKRTQEDALTVCPKIHKRSRNKMKKQSINKLQTIQNWEETLSLINTSWTNNSLSKNLQLSSAHVHQTNRRYKVDWLQKTEVNNPTRISQVFVGKELKPLPKNFLSSNNYSTVPKHTNVVRNPSTVHNTCSKASMSKQSIQQSRYHLHKQQSPMIHN